MPGKPKSTPLKLFVAAVCSVLIGLGLCGIDRHVSPNAEIVGSAGFLGFLLLILAALLCLASVIGFIVRAIRSER